MAFEKIPISLDPEILKAVDEEAKRLQRPGLKPNRSEAIRNLMWEALANRAAKARKKNRKNPG